MVAGPSKGPDRNRVFQKAVHERVNVNVDVPVAHGAPRFATGSKAGTYV